MTDDLVRANRKGRPWPTAAQFNEAVQNLGTAISDTELQAGEAEQGPLGVPMPYAGNFADVYKVHCPTTGNTWAVKFFKREIANLAQRYQAISDGLVAAQLPFMVDFRYLDQGVRIAGDWYPIVKMRWIEGQNLSQFVGQSLQQPAMLDQLFKLWVKLAARLRAAKIAHADLQHGNVVLVSAGDDGRLLLKLIDYDGMYLPALADLPSHELGHASYQHPQRAKDSIYSPEVDRFSHLAICCAIRCLRSGGRRLWERFNNGENLLFTAQDFANPARSTLFRELWTLRNSGARALVGHLLLATTRPLDQTPLLEHLVEDGQVRPLSSEEDQQVWAMLQRHPEPEVTLDFPAPIALKRPSASTPAEQSMPPAAAGPEPSLHRHNSWWPTVAIQGVSAAAALLLIVLLGVFVNSNKSRFKKAEQANAAVADPKTSLVSNDDLAEVADGPGKPDSAELIEPGRAPDPVPSDVPSAASVEVSEVPPVVDIVEATPPPVPSAPEKTAVPLDTPKTPLFNRKDLSGWVAEGKGKWEVIDGILTGSGEKGDWSYLRSVATFGKHFALSARVRIQTSGESGIQCGGQAGKVQGYGTKLTGAKRGFTGAIAQMKDFRWLTGQRVDLYREGDWFDFRLEARDGALSTYVDGNLVARVENAALTPGRITLELDGFFGPAKVEFAEIQCDSLVEDSPIQPGDPLFNSTKKN